VEKKMPGSVASVFSEAEDFEAALSEEGCRGVLLTGRGAFQARLTQIGLHRLGLAAVEEQLPRIAFFSIPAVMILAAFALGRTPSPRWGGIAPQAGENKQLIGENIYSITFPKGQVPPVKGFWSLTLYNEFHLFNPNPLKRYSLGTKNKNLKYNADGSLTIYAGAKSPGKDKEDNWLPAPNGTFSLYIRAYWADEAILDGTWKPPVVSRIQ
jgi:hypothetical protein